MNQTPESPYPDALIIHANYYRFEAQEQVKRSCVFSRLQLCCLSGRGSIMVNKKRYALQAGTLIILPWKHAISYHPDPNDPFHVTGIHLIPYCALSESRTAPWFQTPHEQSHPFANVNWMQDREIPKLNDPHLFQLTLSHSLITLSTYICDVFSRADKNEILIRHLSQCLLHEWTLICAEQQQHAQEQKTWPQHLQRLCTSIRHDPRIQRSLKECAHLAQCSVATLQRHSQRYLQMSILQWQRELQLTSAAELLRSSRKQITEIALDCGFNDPLYFSRVFKKHYAMAPRQYRNHYRLF